MKKTNIELSEWDLDCLKEVYQSWNSLSSNPEDTRSMSDHCHTENDCLFEIITRLEKLLK